MKKVNHVDELFMINVAKLGIDPKKLVDTSVKDFAAMIAENKLPEEDPIIQIVTDEACRNIFKLIGGSACNYMNYCNFTKYNSKLETKYAMVLQSIN